MAKIYVASSWRNTHQQGIVHILRGEGHEVYDFRNPAPGDQGFSWAQISPGWQQWTNKEYMKALEHPIADHGYKNDKGAMDWADHCVLVMPCGRSAHLEAGWMAGAGKRTAVLLVPGYYTEPELMYKLVGKEGLITESIQDIISWLKE